MSEPAPSVDRPVDPGADHDPRRARPHAFRLGTRRTGAGTALILLAFIVVPSAVLGLLSWRAIENEKAYSLERLRASYRQLAGLAARQVDYQLQSAASRWVAEFDDLLSRSNGKPGASDLAAFHGKQPLIAGYFLLSAPGRILYPPVPTTDDSVTDAWAPATRPREHELFSRLVARGEALEYASGDLRAAIAAYREILSHVENPRLRAMAESYIGRAQLKHGDTAEALSTFRHVLERYPDVRDENRMYLRFLAQYQMAVALEGLRRLPQALDVLLELAQDLLRRSDAITSSQYAYYSDLIRSLAPRLLSQPGLQGRARYEQAVRAFSEQSKKRTSEKYFVHLLGSELSEMSFRRKRFNPRTQYMSARAEGDPFLVAYRTLPDAQQTYVTGILAAQIDLEKLQEQLLVAIRSLRADSQAVVAILGSGGGVVIGAEAAAGGLMAAQDLSPPFDFWQVAIYLKDVPTAMKRLDLGRTLWLWLISLMLLSIVFGAYVFILRARRQAYLSRAQTNFVSNVTHELRAPLASIRMFAELLELQMTDAPRGAQERLKKNAAQYLGIIRQECDRLSRLVDGVIDLSRMERHVKQYRFAEDDVDEVVARSVESFRPHAEARGFTLRLSLERPLPPVKLDADAISQVLLNLLSNAAQYSDEDKDIQVRVMREGPGVAIHVSDRGIGIAPGDIEKVFDKFYSTWRRMDSRTQGGLGLGLTLSREIVRAHGGDIRVHSEVGRGSIFTVTLPPATAEASVGERRRPTPDVRATEQLGGQRP